MAGPLSGLRIIEMAGIGPGPFCGMLLADMGAEVIRIDRPGAERLSGWRFDITTRGRQTICLDMKKPGAAEVVLKMLESADAIFEGFRPGVMEQMGLGPDDCLARNPALVYGRMTGWGQFGPLAKAAGHDINYIAISGALHAIGRSGEAPAIPLNYIGDFGGGAMVLAVGMLAGLLEAKTSGKGQVVDAAMTDGSALLSAMFYGFKAAGQWTNNRGENLLDGGAHFYDVYTCADGKYVAVGAIEPKFYRELLDRCGLDAEAYSPQMDEQRWAMLKLKLADVFRSRSRDEWCEILEGTDSCFAPVLDWDEAPQHPHNKARETFVELDGVTHPAPAPRFSRTPSDPPSAPLPPTDQVTDILKNWGVSDELIRAVSSDSDKH
ncbi:MAG: CoA transferase [Ectothiorhodospiraceae bacterium]|nr:CoA transferase [Ectothiorhodospiraceae bacterium]